MIFGFTSISVLAFQLTIDEDHPFGIFYAEEPLYVEQGRAQTTFLFDIPEKYYLYKEKLEIALDQEDVQATLILPPGEKKYDTFLNKETEFYYHQLEVPIHFVVSSKIALPAKISGHLTYQGCLEDKICYRAMNQEFSFSLVSATTTSATSAPHFWEALKTGRFEDILQKGLFFSLFVTFLAGLVTGFTPCVLPVIPLTLTFMGVSKKQDLSQKILSLLIFVFGMVIMYSGLGVLSAILGKTLGFWFQSEWFQVFLVLFFVVMALWMFDVIDLSPSATLQTRLAKYHPRGHLAQLYSGLTIGFLAAPCVGPVIGPLLVYISATKDVTVGFFLMFSYALGLSVLFFVLGFFSKDWIRRFGEKSRWIKKILGILLMLTAGFYVFALVKPFFAKAEIKGEFFYYSLFHAEQEAASSQKGLLVDFFADWCVPCHKWDREVWSQKEVQDLVQKTYVPVKIDCTTETPECQEAVRIFDVIGWPTIVFTEKVSEVPPQEISGSRIVGDVKTKEEFLKYLQNIQKKM